MRYTYQPSDIAELNAKLDEQRSEIERLRAENETLRNMLSRRPTRITEFAPDIRGRLPGNN
jgi:uncharacterized coiled-coil protein SlyX